MVVSLNKNSLNYLVVLKTIIIQRSAKVNMKIQRTVKIEDVLYKWIEHQAEENCRSFSGQIEYMVKQEIKREEEPEND